MPFDIHFSVISQKMLKISMEGMPLEINALTLQSYLPGDNELVK